MVSKDKNTMTHSHGVRGSLSMEGRGELEWESIQALVLLVAVVMVLLLLLVVLVVGGHSSRRGEHTSECESDE